MSLIYKIMLFTLSFHLPPDHRIWWTNVDISTFEAWLLLSSRCWGNCVLRQFSRVQLLSCVWLFATPWTAAYQASLLFQLLELTQTHVDRVDDAIQPSHHLSYPSPPTFNFSQHQGLFKWVSSSHQVTKVLEFQLQPQSFQWIFRTDFL